MWSINSRCLDSSMQGHCAVPNVASSVNLLASPWYSSMAVSQAARSRMMWSLSIEGKRTVDDSHFRGILTGLWKFVFAISGAVISNAPLPAIRLFLGDAKAVVLVSAVMATSAILALRHFKDDETTAENAEEVACRAEPGAIVQSLRLARHRTAHKSREERASSVGQIRAHHRPVQPNWGPPDRPQGFPCTGLIATLQSGHVLWNSHDCKIEDTRNRPTIGRRRQEVGGTSGTGISR